MTISVEYNKRKGKLVVETDEAGDSVDHLRIQSDREIRSLMKYHDIGKVEVCNSYMLKRELNKRWKETSGSNLDYVLC